MLHLPGCVVQHAFNASCSRLQHLCARVRGPRTSRMCAAVHSMPGIAGRVPGGCFYGAGAMSLCSSKGLRMNDTHYSGVLFHELCVRFAIRALLTDNLTI